MESRIIILLVYTVLYFLLASQPGYFALGYYQVLRRLPWPDFISVRRATDIAVRTKLKLLYLSALAAGLATSIINWREFPPACILPITLSVIFLITDIVLAKTVSEKINRIISTTDDEQLIGQSALQAKWLGLMVIRGTINVTGFIILLISILVR